jgi:competence protein ComEC
MTLLFFLLSFCAGIAVYFAMPFEPAVAMPLILSLLFAAIFFAYRLKSFSIAIASCFFFGFFYACAYTRLIDIPRIYHVKRDADISGVVKNIDWTPGKARLLAEHDGALYRLSMPAENDVPNIGDPIKATATLFPPGPADAPGGFDPAEWAYFSGISATGYISEIKASTEQRRAGGIAALRSHLHRKLNSRLFDSLVLGYKRVLTEEETSAWKAAGVAHVFSISGFHITLAAGWLFALFYFLFRAIPFVTRRIPARYPAMACVWAGLLFYLLLSGAEVATQRAFLTTSLMFAAFAAGRAVWSLRNAALVFAALLAANPHYLMEPGFQLSFAAIFGLIWFFNPTRPTGPASEPAASGPKPQKLSLPHKALRMARLMIPTTIVATVFTAPFIAYHFHAVQIYGLLGNLICLPVFSILIMPLTMLGLTGPAEGIYDRMLGIAQWIEGLPFAQMQVPSIPGSALVLMTAGLLCLVAAKSKRAGIAAAAASFSLAFVFVAAKPRPIFYATADHELIAVVQDGELRFNRGKASNHHFAFDTWKQANFEPAGTPNKRIACKKGLCVVRTEKWSLAYTQKFMPLLNNMEKLCAENNFIVSYLDIDAPKNCKAEILRGGFVIYKNGKVERVTSGRWWHKKPDAAPP